MPGGNKAETAFKVLRESKKKKREGKREKKNVKKLVGNE